MAAHACDLPGAAHGLRRFAKRRARGRRGAAGTGAGTCPPGRHGGRAPRAVHWAAPRRVSGGQQHGGRCGADLRHGWALRDGDVLARRCRALRRPSRCGEQGALPAREAHPRVCRCTARARPRLRLAHPNRRLRVRPLPERGGDEGTGNVVFEAILAAIGLWAFGLLVYGISVVERWTPVRALVAIGLVVLGLLIVTFPFLIPLASR